MADMIDGIIVGAAAAAIGTIIAFKFLESRAIGGAVPAQVDAYSPTARGHRVTVQTPEYTDDLSSPLAQNTPITESAYNTYPIQYLPAFNTNSGLDETVLPV